MARIRRSQTQSGINKGLFYGGIGLLAGLALAACAVNSELFANHEMSGIRHRRLAIDWTDSANDTLDKAKATLGKAKAKVTELTTNLNALKEEMKKNPVAKAKTEMTYARALDQLKAHSDEDNDAQIKVDFDEFKTEGVVLGPEMVMASYRRWLKEKGQDMITKAFERKRDVNKRELYQNIRDFINEASYLTREGYLTNFEAWVNRRSEQAVATLNGDESEAKVIQYAFDQFVSMAKSQGRSFYSSAQAKSEYRVYTRKQAWKKVTHQLETMDIAAEARKRVKESWHVFLTKNKDNGDGGREYPPTPLLMVQDYRNYVKVQAATQLAKHYPDEDLIAELEREVYTPYRQAIAQGKPNSPRIHFLDVLSLKKLFREKRANPNFRVIPLVTDETNTSSTNMARIKGNFRKTWSAVGIATAVAAFITAAGALVIAAVVLRNYLAGRSAFEADP